MRHCKDCEPAQEIHFIAYLSVVLGWIDEPFFDLMEKLFKNLANKIADTIGGNSNNSAMLTMFQMMFQMML